MKRGLLGVCGVLLACVALPASAALTASLDSNQIAAGDTVQLTLVHDGSSGGQPDLAPLKQDFDILDESTSNRIELINGSFSSSTQLDLTLSPKHSGQLTVPSITWGSDRSQPLSLTVSGSGGSAGRGAGAATPGRVFITSQVTPSKPYVLSAVRLTVRVYEGQQLYRPSLDLPTTPDVLVRQTGDDQAGTVDQNGQTYDVVTRHYLLFPQHSGTVTLPGPTLSAQIVSRSQANDPFSGFFGGNSPFGLMSTRPIRLHGDPIVLQVRPRPASAASAPYWLPARAVRLSASWNPGSLQAHVGDPVTVDLKVQASGLTAAQLPDLTTLLSLPAGLTSYPEQPKLKDTDQADSVEGSREQSLALIADQPGHYSIPALHVTWWDTASNQARVALLPARTLVIVPAPGAPVAAAPAPSAPAAGSSRSSTVTARAPAAQPEGAQAWRWISGGLAVGWLATIGAWVLSRRAGPPPPRKKPPAMPHMSESFGPRSAQARAAFREACRKNDAPAARRHLLAWAGAVWGTSPGGLSAVAAHLDDPNITALLRDLDRACFAGGPWSGEALSQALAALPGEQPAAARGRPAGLAPLYH